MDYFISMQLRSDVRFSALFLDQKEKSSFYTNDFPSMILQKIICVVNGGNVFFENQSDLNFSINDYSSLNRKQDTIRHDSSTGLYNCQLDKYWFTIHKEILRDALDIIPSNDNHPFLAPPSSDVVIEYVNTPRYPNTKRNVSAMYTGKDKRVIFGMPIPNALLTDDIRSAPYYSGYLEQESTDAPSPAKRTKASKVAKKQTLKSSLQLEDESIDEGVPVNEPKFGDEEVNVQKAIEESLKDAYPTCQGLLPPVVIREPESRKYQPLPEVQEPSGLAESSSLYVELGLTDSETDSNEEVSPEINAVAQEEGQAGPNPDEQDKGQAGSNPGDAAVDQPQSSHVVHARLNLDHMDLGIAEASSQPNPEQMNE
ncbi:hypothetical protein Tco_0300726 [Tanacetum coccineum]